MPIDEASVLAAADELLMRQVHPNMMQEGRPSSGTFTPTQADQGHLSADRETIISPKEAYERYLLAKTLESAGGTWGVSINEFNAAGLICYSDPIETNAAHALVDFASHGANREKALGKLIYAKAYARGRLHPPQE